MKIKQKAPLSAITETKISKKSSNSKYHEPIITPQQMYLPSEIALYRQLVSELGIKKEDLRSFRENFKQKYQKHLKMLQGHQLSQQKFRISRQYQDLQNKNKIKQMRQQIAHKQVEASQRKKNVLTKSRQRIEMEQQNWRQIIDKNKKQYLRNIKNSMKLIKRWENKLSESLARKNQILDKVSYQMQEHNMYVNSVHDHSRIQQNLESQQRILKLEQSLHMQQATRRKKTQNQQREQLLNPQTIRFKSSSKKTTRNSKTVGSEPHFQERQGKIISPFQIKNKKLPSVCQSPTNQQRTRLSKVSSQNLLDVKSELDQQFLQQCLSKNINKQRRIAEARHIKSYLYDQRNKQNKLKKQENKLKVAENLEKMQEEQSLKNKKLDEKFQENRMNIRLIETNSSQKRKNSGQKPTTNVSLPIIQQNSPSKNNSISYESMPLKGIKKPKLSIKYSRSNYQKAPIESTDNTYLFITEDREQRKLRKEREERQEKASERQKQGKYNRKIIEKLRSLSLVANMKYKIQQQKQEKDEMRSLIYKGNNLESSRTKRAQTHKIKY